MGKSKTGDGDGDDFVVVMQKVEKIIRAVDAQMGGAPNGSRILAMDIDGGIGIPSRWYAKLVSKYGRPQVEQMVSFCHEVAWDTAIRARIGELVSEHGYYQVLGWLNDPDLVKLDSDDGGTFGGRALDWGEVDDALS
jgi:hypothetical protein